MNFRNRIKQIVYRCFQIFPLNSNKVVICNYYGKGFGDNGKYIAEYLHENSSALIVWLGNEETLKQLPEWILGVKKDSFAGFFHQATAHVWIDNCRKQIWINKRKSQIYIQTWHGSLLLKKSEKDAEDKLSSDYVKAAKHDSEMIDYLLADSEACADRWAKSFWITPDKIKITGFPRTDIFELGFSAQRITTIKQKLGLPSNTNFFLYAPTFRNHEDDKPTFSLKMATRAFEDAFGGKWMPVIRMHPRATAMAKADYDGEYINATDYGDMQELLLAADALITDYSSCMTEFYLQEKPVFLFANDLDQYVKERGFVVALSDLPSEFATTQDQLINQIRSFSKKDYASSINKFKSKVMFSDVGLSSARTCNLFINQLKTNR